MTNNPFHTIDRTDADRERRAEMLKAAQARARVAASRPTWVREVKGLLSPIFNIVESVPEGQPGSSVAGAVYGLLNVITDLLDTVEPTDDREIIDIVTPLVKSGGTE